MLLLRILGFLLPLVAGKPIGRDKNYHPVPHHLRNCSLFLRRLSPGANFLTSFEFAFQDRTTNTQCGCYTQWYWDGVTEEQGPDNDYTDTAVVCGPCLGNAPEDEVFKMSILHFSGLSNISLRISHKYDDSAHFDPPWTWLTTISHPVVTMNEEVYRDANNGVYQLRDWDSEIDGLIN